MKEKFEDETVKNLIHEFDIVIIMETHFKKRHKCPNDFIMIGRSLPSNSKVGRGGVAVYVKNTFNCKYHVFNDVCPDAVIFEIENTDAIFIALYITPENSIYKEKEIFSIIDFILKNFRRRNIYLFGDLNARCATPTISKNHYKPNPDKVINSYGRKLIKICIDNSLTFINGLIYLNRCLDTNFTFFRGTVQSQNVWCITNEIHSVESFQIMQKLVISDHTPCAIRLNLKTKHSLKTLKEYSDGILSYDHLDKSRQTRQIMSITNLDVPAVIKLFDKIANQMANDIDFNIDINNVCSNLENAIYNSCYANKKVNKGKSKHNLRIMVNENVHLNSSHCHAIANANYSMFTNLLQENTDEDVYLPYLEQWIRYQDLAHYKEEKEYNLKINNKWKLCEKSNSRKLWKLIDWNDKTNKDSNIPIDPKVINTYFTDIFQSKHTKNNPTISDIIPIVQEYDMYIPILDDNITIDEVNIAIDEIGTGTALDGLNPNIAKLFTYNLKLTLINLLNRIHGNCYPESWKNQLLFSVAKKGHTIDDPKLRGIALSSLIPKIYDIILNNRFNKWYYPNVQQAGFRPKQGCLFQIFSIFLMIELANHNNKTIFIGFMDYEKAFDYTNRADIVKDLISKGAGKKNCKFNSLYV